MQTIEERAKSYVEGCELQGKEARKAEFDYIAGAKEEHLLLTEWKDVNKELPDTNRRVLVKTERDGVLMACYGLTHKGRWFVYGFMQGQMPKVMHWRDINEGELPPLPKYYGDDDSRAE